MSYAFDSALTSEPWESSVWGDALSVWRPSHFTPAELFRGGVNGVWFDPSDLSTLFQDAYGLAPVTAADQPVGLMLDKSVIQQHPARRNLLTYSEDFSHWDDGIYRNYIKPTVTVNTDIAPDGTLTADTLTCNHVTSSAIGSCYVRAVANQVVTISVWIKSLDQDFINIWLSYGTSENVLIDILFAGSSITDNWEQIIRSFTLPNNASIGSVEASIGFGNSTIGNTVQVWGAQLETGSTLTAYQKVTTGLGDWIFGNHASQTTDSKRPMLRSDGNLWWLDYDGVDDVLDVVAAIAPGSSTLVDNRVSALTITTGVNVTASYALPANDSHGYVIKPPSLTALETQKLTSYFNAKAGR